MRYLINEFIEEEKIVSLIRHNKLRALRTTVNMICTSQYVKILKVG